MCKSFITHLLSPLNRVLCWKCIFIFVRKEVLFRGGGESQERQQSALRFTAKMRACLVYNGLILCRRHCYHYCSTQLKVLTNVFCLKYCTDILYVYMYSFMNVFLNPYTRTECNCFAILFAVFLKTFQGPRLHRFRQLLLLLYTVCLILCVFLFEKNSSVVERSMCSVWRNTFLFI